MFHRKKNKSDGSTKEGVVAQSFRSSRLKKLRKNTETQVGVDTAAGATTNSAGVTVSTPFKSKRMGKFIAKYLVVVIVLVVGVGGAAGFLAYNKYHKSTPESAEQADKRVADQRVNELEKLIKNEKDAAKKESYQAELALTQANQLNVDQGLQTALDADKAHPTAITASVVAGIYMDKKDYPNAAKYYGLAMDRSPKPASPTERSPYNDFAALKKQAEEMK